MKEFDYSDEQVSALVIALYFGAVSLSNLPKELYKQTVKVLRSALYEGYGGKLSDFEWGTPDHALLKDLRENIYLFSGAKTATQIADLMSLLRDGDRILGLEEYKKVAKARFQVYNGKDSWLESEYITALGNASSAANWQYVQENKDVFPYLKSIVIVDAHTSPVCLRMADVTAPVDSPIWNHNMPLRHFRCRCDVERIDKYTETHPTPEASLKRIQKLNDEEMDDLFKMNPGRDRYIFSEKHPYFEIGKKNPELGRMNFGLDIPTSD